MKPDLMKRTICYTMVIVCLGAAAILPLCALPSIHLALREIASYRYSEVNGTALLTYYTVLAALAALSLIVSCAGVVREAGTAEYMPKRLVILGQWFAIPIDALLCFTSALWKTGYLIPFWPGLAIVLAIFALLFVRTLNRGLSQ